MTNCDLTRIVSNKEYDVTRSVAQQGVCYNYKSDLTRRARKQGVECYKKCERHKCSETHSRPSAVVNVSARCPGIHSQVVSEHLLTAGLHI